jgi:hypothetical protein
MSHLADGMHIITPNDLASLGQLSANPLTTAEIARLLARLAPPGAAVRWLNFSRSAGIHRQRPARPHGPHQPPPAARQLSGQTATD